MDLLRLVTVPRSGRPAVELDLQDGVTMFLKRSTFTITPPPKKQQQSTIPGRYGGSLATAESHDNGRVGGTWIVRGVTRDQSVTNIDNLLMEVDDLARGRYLEWRPEGTTNSTLFEIRGPGEWKPTYEWAQFAGAGSMEVEISWPVAPLALGPPFDVFEFWDVDSRADYTFDAGASANLQHNAGVAYNAIKLQSLAAAVGVEHRLIHSARGYLHRDVQVTRVFHTGATLSGFKAGGIPKRTAASTYAECYVDDTGTVSRLRIDVVIDGVRTNRFTVNLTARLAVSTANYHVVARIEGDIVYAEYFAVSATAPTPITTPTHSGSYTLAVGTERDRLGAAVEGQAGVVWTPPNSGLNLGHFYIEPMTYRAQVLPQRISLGSTIPGTAPTLMDVAVTHNGAATVRFALIGFSKRPASTKGFSAGSPPFTIIEAESGSFAPGGTSANANDRGGSSMRYTPPGGTSGGYGLTLDIEPSEVVGDDFAAGEVDVEVWARGIISPGGTDPLTAILSTRSLDGSDLYPRYSHEYGAAGKALVKPSSGAVYRFWRLGVVTLSVAAASKWLLMIDGNYSIGTGAFGFDYVILVPVRRRVASPTGKAFAYESYPAFQNIMAPIEKVTRSDGSGFRRVRGHYLLADTPDHGLGGAPIEVPPGDADLLVKLSSLVPDDPTVDTSTETLSHTATVHASCWPRFRLARGV